MIEKRKNLHQSCLLSALLLLSAVKDAFAAAVPLQQNENSSNVESRSWIASNGGALLFRHLILIDNSEDLPPLFPLQWEDYVGFGVAIFGLLLLAAGGGIGGGGILVPVYVLLLNFPLKHAIPLASTTVFGGAVASNMLNCRKSHPNHPFRSVIDWELILQLEPMTILGTLVGAILNDFLPDLVLLVMMVLLLAVTAYEALVKARQLQQKSDNDRLKTKAVMGETKPLITNDIDDIDLPVPSVELQRQNFEEHLRKNYTQAALWAATKLTILFVVVTTSNLLKGGRGQSGGGPLGLEVCDGTCFWVVQSAIGLGILLFAVFARSDLLSRIEEGKPVSSDIDWNKDNTIAYPCYAIVAGLVVGLFGVGGGIIKGPMMWALRVHPAVASATSACMILFTSSTATVSYMIFGFLVPDYAIFCLLIGFCCTIAGQTGMSMLLRRYKRNSYVVYSSIGGVVDESAVVMGIESVIALTE